MSHFVSASCGGEMCRCGRPATHKVGEEIMHDEPCVACGGQFVSPQFRPDEALAAHKKCASMFHIVGPGGQRHNLTAYVCCLCFTRLLGKATGCPLTADEQKSLDNYNYAHDLDVGYGPPCELVCPRCDVGTLKVEGSNPKNVLVGCANCGCGCYVANKEKNAESDQGGTSKTDNRAQEGKDGPG